MWTPVRKKSIERRVKAIYAPNSKKCVERHRGENGVIAYCDHCGFAIYVPGDAVEVDATGDTIHKDCWEEYSSDHMSEFVSSIEVSDEYDADEY